MKTILVTGGNKGIGYEAVRLLSERDGDATSTTILLGTRSLANGDAAVAKMRAANSKHAYSNVFPLQLDVTSPTSIHTAVDRVKTTWHKLDVLVNNSGVAVLDAEETLAVNLHGVRNTTLAFLPLLSPGSTVVVVSSTVGSFSLEAMGKPLQDKLVDIQSLTWEGIDSFAKEYLAHVKAGTLAAPWPPTEATYGSYGISKTFVSAWSRVFAKEHPELNVAVVCPGYCATDLNGNRGTRSAALGGESVIWPIFNKFDQG
ncbi:hypothetical protein HK101_002285, partial [Irineochytrium annulatum]